MYFNDNFDVNKSKNSRNFQNNVPKLNFTSINKKNNNYYNINNNVNKGNIKKQKNEKKNNFNWNLNINHCQKKVFNFISNSNSFKYNMYKNN